MQKLINPRSASVAAVAAAVIAFSAASALADKVIVDRVGYQNWFVDQTLTIEQAGVTAASIAGYDATQRISIIELAPRECAFPYGTLAQEVCLSLDRLIAQNAHGIDALRNAVMANDSIVQELKKYDVDPAMVLGLALVKNDRHAVVYVLGNGEEDA